MVATGTQSLQNGAVGESARGYDMLDANNVWPAPREIAYLHSATMRATDPRFRAAIADVATRLRIPGVELTTPSDGPRLISKDGRSALLVATLTNTSAENVRARVLGTPAHTGVTIEETGDITASDARDKSINDDLHRAEILSVPVTFFVLIFAFGALVAATVRVLLALTAVAAAFGLLGPISQAIPIDDSVRTVLVLIGMAVGVDYALFYIIRSREERRRGRPPHEALERTIRTSGRTVIVSGTTVIVAMAAMFLVGTKVFNSLAAATITVVACAVVGSVTGSCAGRRCRSCSPLGCSSVSPSRRSGSRSRRRRTTRSRRRTFRRCARSTTSGATFPPRRSRRRSSRPFPTAARASS
jgi:putative drug exporter of the RND superfamily